MACVSLVHPALPAGSPAASRSGSLASRSGRLAPPAAAPAANAEGELGRVSSAAYVTKAMSSFVRSASEKVSVWFAAAGREIKCLSVMPANLDLLALYGLYAQATKGDQTAKKPGWTNLKARGKWEYWQKHRGKSKAEAMREYIALVEEFKVKYRFDPARTPVEVGGKWNGKR